MRKFIIIIVLLVPLLSSCGLGIAALGIGGASYLIGKGINEGKETQVDIDLQYERLNLQRAKEGLPLYVKNKKGIWVLTTE